MLETCLSEFITLSRNFFVGVANVKAPTFITPVSPTTIPLGFKKKTFPAIFPFLKEFNVP